MSIAPRLPVFAESGLLRDRTDSCVSRNGFCLDWILANFDRYTGPLTEHVYLTVLPVAVGLLIALGLGLVAHRRRWLIPPLTGVTTTIYTIPSPALFILLTPLTGRGNLPGLIALAAYTQVIIFRNVITGLSNVPRAIVDAAHGMGMTSRQVLWRVELPLAVPEILAGVRIATATTVGLAALIYLAGGGGMGAVIDADLRFKSNVVTAATLLIALAAVLDLLLLGVQRLLTPWRRVAT
ncbi:MAG: ABC transporter permease [Chloroflexota bacterium]|nr:ABC transporter permease [Chloroflexota bacterium]